MTTAKRLLASMALVLVALSAVARSPLEQKLADAAVRGCSISPVDIADTLASRPLADIEGLWRMAGQESTFAIIRDNADRNVFILIVVEPADRNVASGFVMGVATPAAAANTFDAQIFSKVSSDGLTRPQRFTLTLTDDSRLVMQPVKKGLKFNILRLIPYMYRVSVRQVDDRQRGLDGALRILPADRAFNDSPVYL